MKKTAIILGIIILVLATAIGSFYGIYVKPFLEKMTKTEDVRYDKTLSLVLGGGGNSGIYNLDSLVIVIDTKQEEAAEKLAEKVKKLAGKKPILVVNTHYHPDHTNGNRFYKGQAILAGGNYTKEFWEKEVSKDILPTIWLQKDTDIISKRDTITIFGLHENIHTASDVFVYDHRRKLLFGGDVILNKQNPVILGDANPNNYLNAFDELEKRYAIEIVVPGHGTIGGKYVIDSFRTYFLDMKFAAENPEKEDSLVAKYTDWGSIPFVMSPAATIRSFKKQLKLKH